MVSPHFGILFHDFTGADAQMQTSSSAGSAGAAILELTHHCWFRVVLRILGLLMSRA